MKTRAIIYRDNQFWAQIKDAILEFAQKAKGGGDVKIVQVFPMGTPDEEIATWYSEHKSELVDVEIVCDGTFEIIARRSTLMVLDMACGWAIDKMLGGKDIFAIYQSIFSKLIAKLGIEKVQLVSECLGDYNPLKLEGCDERTAETSRKYVEAFTSIMPQEVQVEEVSIDSLTIPGPTTLVVAHHHALQRLSDWGEGMQKSGRVINPYVKGVQAFASEIIDLGEIFPEDVVEVTRKLLLDRVAK